MYIHRHFKFIETEFPYTSLISHSTCFDSSDSDLHSFSIPLTTFVDIVVSVPSPQLLASIPTTRAPIPVPLFDSYSFFPIHVGSIPILGNSSPTIYVSSESIPVVPNPAISGS